MELVTLPGDDILVRYFRCGTILMSVKRSLRYRNRFMEDPIIRRNPDVLSREERILLFEVPKILPLILNGKGNERVHYSNRLKAYSQKEEFRIALALCENFLEVCAEILCEEEQGIKDRVLHRLKEHILATLNYILQTENRVVTDFIIYDPKFLPGLVRLFNNPRLNLGLRRKMSENFRLICRNRGARKFIGCFDNSELLQATYFFLQNCRNEEVRENVIFGYEYLSRDSTMKLLLPRNEGFLDTLFDGWDGDISVSILRNLLSIKENLPVLTSHAGLVSYMMANEEISELMEQYDMRGDVDKLTAPHERHFFEEGGTVDWCNSMLRSSRIGLRRENALANDPRLMVNPSTLRQYLETCRARNEEEDGGDYGEEEGEEDEEDEGEEIDM